MHITQAACLFTYTERPSIFIFYFNLIWIDMCMQKHYHIELLYSTYEFYILCILFINCFMILYIYFRKCHCFSLFCFNRFFFFCFQFRLFSSFPTPLFTWPRMTSCILSQPLTCPVCLHTILAYRPPTINTSYDPCHILCTYAISIYFYLLSSVMQYYVPLIKMHIVNIDSVNESLIVMYIIQCIPQSLVKIATYNYVL